MQLPKMPPGRAGQMPESHITARSGMRCDRLCPIIAELTSFTAFINQRHQYLTDLHALTVLGKDSSEPFLHCVVKGFYITQTRQIAPTF